MKNQLISSMASFVLGTGVTLASLLSWTGASSLDDIRTSVQNYIRDSEHHASALVEDYQVTVENANAEIGEYKVALQQANDNISQLITAYENAEEEHRHEILALQGQAENDLADLQQELEIMQRKLDYQYESDMNSIIVQANEQINNANQEVADTRQYIEEELLPTSQVDEIVENAKQLKDQLDTGNDKSVQDISSVIPTEEQGE